MKRRLVWHTYEGGTFGGGKKGYSAHPPEGNYKIDPVTWPTGRFRGYVLTFENVKGRLSGGLHQPIYKSEFNRFFSSPNEAKRRALEHYGMFRTVAEMDRDVPYKGTPRHRSLVRTPSLTHAGGHIPEETMRWLDRLERKGIHLHPHELAKLRVWRKSRRGRRSAFLIEKGVARDRKRARSRRSSR